MPPGAFTGVGYRQASRLTTNLAEMRSAITIIRNVLGRIDSGPAVTGVGSGIPQEGWKCETRQA